MNAARLLSHRADVAPDASADGDGDRMGPMVARPRVRRDHALPILIAASLFVHVTIILPSLLRHDTASPPPQEIPVEIVQLPPKAAAKPPPKPAAPKPPATKPQAPKPQPPKPQARKPEPPKPQAAKPPAPKPVAVAQKPPPKPQRLAQRPPPKPPQPQQASTAERMQQLLGAMPAIALPGASTSGTDEVSYAQLVLSKVAKAKKEGRYTGTAGATSVTFTLGDSGEIASVSIVKPSGERWLDDEAIAMVKRAAPYPPPPPGGRRDYTITLRFQPVI